VASTGGGLVSLDRSTVIERCVFEECVGGGALIQGHAGLSATVRDCVFRNNTGEAALILLQMPDAEVSRSVFAGNSSPLNAAALVVNSATGATIVRDNLFAANDGSVAGPVVSWNGPGEVRSNTFWGNESKPGYGTFNDGAPAVLANTLTNNIFAENAGGAAVRVLWLQPISSCNLFWQNAGGDYVGEYVPSPTDLFVDPLLCDPAVGDFHLMAGSPCLPENSGVCGLIGAFGAGCGVSSVGEAAFRTWGRIKAAYR
jgi:hypothetical protein